MENVTAVITQERAKISCNFEQVKNAIEDTLSEYKGAVFTEESKPAAKKEVAKLRKDKKYFQDNLRDAKKVYMEPWDNFEVQAKELIAMYDEPINHINGQIQEFEENRIAKKKELIAQIYEELVTNGSELSSYIPLVRIYNQKWENATKKENEIRKEISDIAEKTQRDINTISSMGSEAVLKALDMYHARLDLNEAITYINSYEQQKREILEREHARKRAEEEERIRREERERMMAEQRAREEQERLLRQAEAEREETEAKHARESEEVQKNAVESRPADDWGVGFLPEDSDELPFEQPVTITAFYRVVATAEELEQVEMAFNSIGIYFERRDA